MIELPVGTLPVDFLTSFMALFRSLAENQTGEIKVLLKYVDNVRFSENDCFAVHKGERKETQKV